MRRLAAALIVTIGASFVTVIGDADRTEQFGPVDHVGAKELRHHLEYIASDALEGRDALSSGFRAAADYVAAQLRDDGVSPAGDNGTYFQDVGIRRTTVDATRAVVTLGDARFSHGTDFLAPSPGKAAGALVYVGHGWRVPSKQLDPFKGLDVKGKWLVILPGSPDELTPSDLAKMVADVDFVQPEANARQLGAIGIVKLPSSYDLNHWERDASRETTRGELVVDRLDPPVTRLPQIAAGARLINRLFEGEVEDGAQDVVARRPPGRRRVVCARCRKDPLDRRPDDCPDRAHHECRRHRRRPRLDAEGRIRRARRTPRSPWPSDRRETPLRAATTSITAPTMTGRVWWRW